MTTRTVGVWAGFIVMAGSLTGCASPATFKNVPAPPTGAQANSSGLSGQSRPATTKPQGDPSALAAPMGNTPQFSNQPFGGILPAGGLAPPVPVPAGSPVPASAAPASVPSTSNMLPTINGVSSSTPVPAAPAPAKQVAINAVRTTDPTPKAAPVPAAPVVTAAGSASPSDSSDSGPTMPPASSGSELPVQPPQPITHLSPVTLPPTTVRQ